MKKQTLHFLFASIYARAVIVVLLCSTFLFLMGITHFVAVASAIFYSATLETYIAFNAYKKYNIRLLTGICFLVSNALLVLDIVL